MLSLIRIVVACLLAFSITALPVATPDSQAAAKNPVDTTPRLEKLFTSQAMIGTFNDPIPIPGGQRIVAKVTGGAIKGKAITGTFKGGITVIDILNGGQTIVNTIRTFGSTTDGTPFLIDENGIGSSADDFARLLLSAGGNLTSLTNEFVITEATLAADQKSVMTAGYRLLDQ
ncbi:MAG: hypothetical protein Q9168_002752 [Polycauliona sp. 1 TL-2023]